MELPEGLEDYVEPEIGLAAVAVAALFSPKVRRGLRWGLVQGLSVLIAANDNLIALARQLTPSAPNASDLTFRQQLIDEARVEQAKKGRTAAAAERQKES